MAADGLSITNAYPAYMARKWAPGTFRNSVRAWLHLNLTQEKLVARLEDLGVKASTATLSRVENGSQNFDAELLQSSCLELRGSGFNDAQPSVKEQIELFSVIRGMSDDQQKQALRVIKAITEAA